MGWAGLGLGWAGPGRYGFAGFNDISRYSTVRYDMIII